MGQGAAAPQGADRRVRLVVIAWACLAVTAFAVSIALGGQVAGRSSSLPPALALALAAMVAGMVYVKVPVRSTTEATNLSELAYVPIMLLLPPDWAVVVALVAALVSETVLTRGQGRKLVFNVSWHVAGVAAGAWVSLWLGARPFDAGPASLTAAAAAALVLITTNLVAFSPIIAIRDRRRCLTVLREEAPASMAINLGTGVLGILATTLIVTAPYAVPLVAIPTLLHTGRMRARSEGRHELAAERNRFERTVAGTSDGVVLLDSDHRVEVWNPPMADLTGIDADRALGATLAELDWPQLDPARDGGAHQRRLRVGERTIDVRVADLDAAAGGAGRVITVRDITRETELSRIREDLVARVSHEMRTPLTTVAGFLETLVSRWDGLDEIQRRRLLEVAWRSAGRLNRLVSNLMVWARIEARVGPEQGASAAPVRQIVEEVVTAASLSASVEIDADAAVTAAISARDLRTIVANLVDNAAVYGEPPIRIRATAGDTMVRIDVTDQGHGLPPGFEAQLYKPFSQASSGLQRTAKGLGMGLAVTRALATSVGGDVRYEDLGDRGTRFTVTLPRVPTATATDTPGSADSQRAAPASAPDPAT